MCLIMAIDGVKSKHSQQSKQASQLACLKNKTQVLNMRAVLHIVSYHSNFNPAASRPSLDHTNASSDNVM